MLYNRYSCAICYAHQFGQWLESWYCRDCYVVITSESIWMSKHVAESINLTTDCRKFWPRRPSSSVYKAGKTRKLVDQSPLWTRHRLRLLVMQMQPCQSSRRVQASISIWMSHSLHVQLPVSLHLQCVSTVFQWLCVCTYVYCHFSHAPDSYDLMLPVDCQTI